jgi:hypothetical protein
VRTLSGVSFLSLRSFVGASRGAAVVVTLAACGSSNAHLVRASGPGDLDSSVESGAPATGPGAAFDLSLWELQEPVGAAGSPTTILPSALEGANGYHDAYFYLDGAGAMTFWDPENGVTTADSSYPRSELREMNADGTTANWPVEGTNTLAATVAVTQVPDHVCVGQIHIGAALDAGLASSTKPLLELYYYQDGSIEVGIENSPTGGQTVHMLANVALGTKFTYAIVLTGAGAISVAINGQASMFTMPSAFAGYGEYFKAGDYDQTAGTDASVGATVKFYALAVSHGP